MYNLSACNFQSFGEIWAWFRPVSELNILYNEWIITETEAEATAKYQNLNGEYAVRIFEKVHDSYRSCVFDVDYDCDWITNWQDNCPYVYNINQFDLDGDWKWNVCDDDIDWDGTKNPIWIVDDNDNIVISLWNDKLDKTPLWNMDWGYTFFINVDSIKSYSVIISPLTDWNISKIERDFWDGVKQPIESKKSVTHTYKEPWMYTVKAIATSTQWNKSFATTKIFIADQWTDNYALSILPKFSYKNGNVEYNFTPMYSWNLDSISWTINDAAAKKKKICG